MSENLTPPKIVEELNKHIVGQKEAKRAVAIALRNRWRRQHVPEEIRPEITPKNILMIGPTGVGKTEIARRLAKLTNAPFIKVEATKFTEVGYVGRDVESIIRDLIEMAIKMARMEAMDKTREAAKEAAKDRVLNCLLPPAPKPGFANEPFDDEQTAESPARQVFRKRLEAGELDDTEIEIDVQAQPVGVEIMAPPGMEEMTSQLQNLFQNMSGDKKKRKKMTVAKALTLATEEEAAKLVNDDEIKQRALTEVEQNGIVFIDEIDKVTSDQQRGGEVSREGVQRDLLPLVEGTSVQTKYGIINTNHILFICSGAFQMAKPSDLIPELQGRLPIRVELSALTSDDFMRILTEPDCSLTEQYQALLATEEVNLEFQEDGLQRLAEVAYQVNEKTENIGARRLHTIMERLLEDISYNACENSGERVIIDQDKVNETLANLAEDEDLSRFIL